MRRLSAPIALAAVALLGALWLPGAARADFGLSEFDVAFSGAEGQTVSQAGSHPDAMDVSLHFETIPTEEGGEYAEEAAKDVLVTQIAGFVGNPTAVPRCATADFLATVSPHGPPVPDCPDASALGYASVSLASKKATTPSYGALYNLEPPPGVAAKLGFRILTVSVTIELGVEETPPYSITGGPTNISQVLEVVGSHLQVWGVPADPAHDELRGHCFNVAGGGSFGQCGAGIPENPFLTLPRACEGPLASTYRADSWQHPGVFAEGSSLTHDEAGNPLGMTGCAKLAFGPDVAVVPSTAAAESAAGLRIAIDVRDEGLANPEGLAAADIAATELRLPAGMTVNPSAAEGLGVCERAQFEAASLKERGCPESSKLGSLEVDTPVLENHTLHGSFYLASQEDNPFDSLLAAYMTIRDEELGVFVKLPARIDTDPRTGQILTTVKDMPPFPLERVRVELRSGARAPLVTPPECGSYETEAILTPSSGAPPLRSSSAFRIDSGPGGGPCPEGLGFDPGFRAGTESNAAGAYSPFSLRLTRADGEQDITRFDATLPPGAVARLAGVKKCPDAAIAAAKGRAGRAELAAPSCPGAAQIGRIQTGAGVGQALTYVPGRLYLAGPYGGAPLSVVAIVPAVAGPFDVGTVVVRQALALDPVTGRAKVDSANSDPIPHILEGIPVKVREIEVDVDRPQFTLNPTSCAEKQTLADIWGGGTDFLSATDDSPVDRSSRFQAASCASLAFKPRLAIRLNGGTRRGEFPALKAVVRPRAGQANFRRAAVTLPKSAFLEQGHIRTICTRVQFTAGAGHGAQCPKGSVYGHARAWSPLLEGPAEGPVFLRSSTHRLPDLVVALKGPDSAPVQVELASRIDSVRLGREAAGIRSVFAAIPDLPVSRFVLAMRGGNKGLIVNSEGLCRHPARNRARAALLGQNGKRAKTRPAVAAARCQRQRKAEHARAGRRGAR